MADIWTIIGSLSTTAAAAVAAWALVQNSRALQMQVFESTFKGIRDLERLYYESYSSKTEEQKRQWDALYFNTLEYLAFLIDNNRMMRHGKMFRFYRDAFIVWWDMFQHLASEEEKNDPTLYTTFKKLAKEILGEREAVRSSLSSIRSPGSPVRLP